MTNAAGLPDFDTIYGLARGGVVTRIDGGTNAPGLGTWQHSEVDGIVLSALLFNFPGGVVPTPATRKGAIIGNFAARVRGRVTLNTITN